MNTFWLKIALVFVFILGGIVFVSVFFSGSPEPEKPQKTFYDQAEEDKENFLAKPEALDTQEPPTATTPGQTPAKTESVQSAPPAPKPAEPPQPTVLYFKPLDEIDNIEAERLLSVAVPGRSISRLPMTGSKLMVDNCRQIIRRWPDSYFAYQAKRMLADLPERDQTRYSITKEEMDVSRFAESRPGTQPFKFEETR
ncbi:MAG: hypothetical protein JXM79_04170 [Sedimentisphaerales bacterium]|nr:hypothetical protein [Sedimentisphaerales bacterium]